MTEGEKTYLHYIRKMARTVAASEQVKREHVVEFPDGLGGDAIVENTFRGPLDEQLRGALRYLRGMVSRNCADPRASVRELCGSLGLASSTANRDGSTKGDLWMVRV